MDIRIFIKITLYACMMAILFSCNNGQKIQNAEANTVSEEINQVANITFPKQAILAIAVVPDGIEESFAQKYFPNGGYYDMKTIDAGEVMRFIIAPKDKNVKFSVFPCDFNDENEIVKIEPAYIEDYSVCLKINTDEVEYIPHICIVYESNGI